jgi:hypothetical protein
MKIRMIVMRKAGGEEVRHRDAVVSFAEIPQPPRVEQKEK